MEVIEANKSRLNNLLDVELRHLDGSKLIKLSTIIDKGDAWRHLLGQLTHNNETQRLHLTTENITLIEKQIFSDKSPSLAFLNYWSITGRRRPTVRTLINHLNTCNLRWAEEYVYESILGLKKVPVNQHNNSDETQTISNITREIDNQFKFDNLDEFIESLDYKCQRFEFKNIFRSANGFCDKPFDYKFMTGTKIGEGRFSSVYRCRARIDISDSSAPEDIVAAKLLKSECNMTYLANEINLMAKLNHPNLVNLLGISFGKPINDESAENRYICLIYPFIENGSLLDCLYGGLCTRNMEYIKSYDRINIAKKVANGIDYLHRACSTPLIHRDIKTANIFIDTNIEPKLGDFTLLSKLKNAYNSATDIMQSSIIGTSVYMAPETFQGDVSTKSDAFSFGIVLLELLTGLRPCDENLDEDLFSYISERLSDIEDELESFSENYDELRRDKIKEFLTEILDDKAGEWNFGSVEKLFEIAISLTESRKTRRPEVADIISQLEELVG